MLRGRDLRLSGRHNPHGFRLFHEIKSKPASAGLARLVQLVQLVADGGLRPQIALAAPWTDVAPVAQRLLDRDFPGKAMLRVKP